MKIDGLTHPKTKELAYSLEIPLPHAIGLLELLWAFVAQQTPQGNVGKWSNAVIAGEAGWTGDADAFVQALIDVRYLDEHETHRLLVHDWADHAPNWVHAKLKKNQKSIISADLRDDLRAHLRQPEDPIPEATTSLAKPSQAKPSQAKSVPNGTGAEAPNLWDVGKKKLGIPGDLIGKWIKQHTEAKVAEAIAAASVKNPADPKAWVSAYLQDRPKNVCPEDPNQIEAWARANGHPPPKPGESTFEYRKRLSA